MVLGKSMAIIAWEWGRIRDGQKIPCLYCENEESFGPYLLIEL